MPHSDDADHTAKSVDSKTSPTSSEATPETMPLSRKSHHIPTPKKYSPLMTMGWKRPIIRNVATPIIIPVKCSSIVTFN